MFNYTFLKSILTSCLLALIVSACGDSSPTIRSGNPNPPNETPGISITGTATAPGGAVAQLMIRQPFLHIVVNSLVSPVYADITNLVEVGGATVQLIRIDDDGNQVGAVLASTVTSSSGFYSLQLPAGVPLSADLIVRITGTGVSMAAMVVDVVVHINPISQFLLDKFVRDPTLRLADLPFNQIVALRGRVEAFDFTAEADLTTMLAKLEADLGDLAETEIAEIQRTPADSDATTAAAGTWNLIGFNIGMDDNETQTFGRAGIGITSASLLFEAGVEAGTLAITQNLEVDSSTALNVDLNSVSIFNQISSGEDTQEFAASIDANGNLTVQFPFEEELQTVGNADPDGPDFGTRYPPRTLIVRNTGNGNAIIATYRESSVRYETVDTDNNNIKDAINLEAKDGDETDIQFNLLLKAGDGMDESSLDGNYGFVTLLAELQKSGEFPVSAYQSTVAKADFDGAGLANIPANGLEEIGFSRFPFLIDDVSLETLFDESGGQSLEYSVSPTGAVTLQTHELFEGWTNNDGSIFSLVNVTPTEFEGEITEVVHELMLGVKLPSADVPTLNSAVFRIFGLVVGADEGGGTEVFTFSSSSTASFDDSGASLTVNATIRGFERNADIASVNSIVEAGAGPLVFPVTSIGEDGSISLNRTDGGDVSNLKGFVSADGKIILLRLNEVEQGTDTYRNVGLIILVRK